MPARSIRVRRVSSQRTRSASASSRRTRSVTSSRFPIGVAQTASGTQPPRRAPRRRRARRRRGRRRSRARRGRSCTPRPRRRAPRARTTSARAEDEVAGRAKPPPMTISSGLKTLTIEPMPEPRWAPMSARISFAPPSPWKASRTSWCASAASPNASARAACRVPGGVGLDVAVAAAGAGRPSRTITTCPSSAPAPVEPRYGLPPRISPPPTPVPSVSRSRRRRPALRRPSTRRSRPRSRRCRSRRGDGSARSSGPGSRGRRAGCSPRRARPGPLVDARRDSEADRVHVVVEELLHERVETGEQLLLASRSAWRPRGALDRPVG